MSKTPGGNPFKAWAKKLEKVFKPGTGGDSGSDDVSVQAAVGHLNLPPERRKEVERAVREQLARQREEEAEKRRQELLEGTTVKMPWKPKARPGDEMYPTMRSKSVRANTSATSPSTGSGKKKPSADISQTSGLEPPPIDVDEETAVNSVRSSSLRMLLEDLAKDAERTHAEPTKKQKPLQAMSPTEIVELRRRDEDTWRRLIRENTIMAVASSAPTDDDVKRAEEVAKKAASTHRTRIKFNEAMETIFLPVGQPYTANEQVTKQTGQLEMEKVRKA